MPPPPTVSHLSEFTLDCLIVEKRKTAPALRLEKFYPSMLGYLLQYVLEARNLQELEKQGNFSLKLGTVAGMGHR